MKQKNSSLRRPFDPTESEPDFLGPIAPEVAAPLTFPKFPTLEQVLLHQRGVQAHPLMELSETKPPSSQSTIFDGMLGGNLDVLAQDVDKNPERYSDRERAFMDELRTGQKDVKALTLSDAQTLSQMVYNFAAMRPAKSQAPTPAKPPTPKRKKPVLMRDEDELPDARDPQVDIDGEPPAYWWAQ